MGTATTTRRGSCAGGSGSSWPSAAPASPRRESSLPETAPSDCVFCRIVEGNLPATVVNRADGFLAIEDINPKAETHVLVVPERHVETFRDVGELSADEAKRMLDFVADTARTVGLEEYRLMIFCGAGAGQTVFHLHWHVLGGRVRGMPA